MWQKAEQYFYTIKYLKKSQLKYLLKNRLERGRKAVTKGQAPAWTLLRLWIPALDEDADYLRRFDTDELLADRVTLLYECGEPGGTNWTDEGKSHLWNFNLHYLEFLIPLAAAWRKNRDWRYYECFKKYCLDWMHDNRDGSGDGWHPYTISLRLTNLWICIDGFREAVCEDREFFSELNDSMYAQYRHLQKKLERHLLGNHYFENLKAVLLGSLYFKEIEVYNEYKKLLLKEIEEQILPDGIHYERSLMYHKIILEDILRTAKAVQGTDEPFCGELRPVMRRMADALDSLESGMGRTLLFNDAGDNVARPTDSLLEGLKAMFQITPQRKSAFPDAGYYCLQEGAVKLVMDAGEIAPVHMPGHGHCDALSFELSLNGHPLFVNSGTGQYQGEYRAFFRSTRAHNTVVIDGQEQSQCWGEHRVAKRISKVSAKYEGGQITGELMTAFGKRQRRRIELKDSQLEICDWICGHAQAYLHLASGYRYEQTGRIVRILDANGSMVGEVITETADVLVLHTDGELCLYAPQFGRFEKKQVLEIGWDGSIGGHDIRIRFCSK